MADEEVPHIKDKNGTEQKEIVDSSSSEINNSSSSEIYNSGTNESTTEVQENITVTVILEQVEDFDVPLSDEEKKEIDGIIEDEIESMFVKETAGMALLPSGRCLRKYTAVTLYCPHLYSYPIRIPLFETRLISPLGQ